MADNARASSLEDLVDLLPTELRDDGARKRLRKLSRHLDALTAEVSGEVIVDRASLRQLIKDDEIFPPELHDRIEREAEGHLGKKLKDKGKGRSLSWREMAAGDNPIEPVAPAQLRALGLDASTSVADARRVLSEHFPDLPDAILDADGPALRDIATRGLEHNRTVWDCVVAKLGFWAALGIFAAAGAFLIVGTATGPWGIPLAIWLIGVIGGGSAVIVANCVLNPNM